MSDSSGNSSPLHPKADNKEKSTFEIPKKTDILPSKNKSDPEVDYDDDVVDDFVSDIFDLKSSPTTPSSSPKINNHLKKGEDKKKSRIEPENTELRNSGLEKADLDPVSKSQN